MNFGLSPALVNGGAGNDYMEVGENVLISHGATSGHDAVLIDLGSVMNITFEGDIDDWTFTFHLSDVGQVVSSWTDGGVTVNMMEASGSLRVMSSDGLSSMLILNYQGYFEVRDTVTDFENIDLNDLWSIDMGYLAFTAGNYGLNWYRGSSFNPDMFMAGADVQGDYVASRSDWAALSGIDVPFFLP